METKFQTSFIPKKPFSPIGGINTPAPQHSHTTSLFLTLAGLLFIISIVAAGGMYFWKSYLLSAQASYKTELAERERQFNSDLIEELKRQNVKIDLAKNLINEHISTSQIFDIIEHLTIEKVRFLSLDLSAPNANSGDGFKLSMKGYGTNLPAIAFQSDVLGKLQDYGLRKVVKNPILSDPSVDVTNTVSFGLSATVEPTSLSYRKSLVDTSATSTTP